jgi:hypothetical protein
MDLKQPPTNNMMDPSKYGYADDSANKQDNQAKDNASKKKSGPSGDLFAIISVLFQLFVLVIHINPFIESFTEHQSTGIFILALYYYHLPLLIIGGVLQHVASKEAKKLRPLIHVASALFVIALIIIIWTYANLL